MPPEVPSDPAREGTCAAWVAEMVLTGQAAKTADLIGTTHSNGWVVTADMAAYINGYVTKLRSFGGNIYVERKVRLNQHVQGTPDGFSVLDAEGVLRVKDLKYGYLIVEPFQNEQICTYAGAILRYLSARNVVIRRVEISVYQPRAWHPLGIDRSWWVEPSELMQFVHQIERASEACQDPAAPLKAGDHCHYCPAASSCPTFAHEVYRIVERVSMLPQRHMSEEELSRELDFFELAEKMVTGRAKAVRVEAAARVERGQHIPGYHMERAAGQRRWKFPPDVVKALTGVDITEVSTISPAEAERRGVHPDYAKSMTETPQLAPRLRKVPHNFYNQLFARKGKANGET